MKSYVTVSYQIDDPAAAAKELVQGVGPLLANSMGLLFCYSDADQAALLGHLQSQVSFPVVGCTTIASMDQTDGFHALAATLTVLTAEDCAFHTGLSQPITGDNVVAQIESTYRQCAQDRTPGLLIALAPYQLEIMLDVYSDTLGRIAAGVPVIGGLPSYNAAGDENLVFFGENAYPDRLVLVSITGNIRPVFTVKTVTSGPIERKRKVTASKDNVIYRLGEQTFTEYLSEIGMPVEMLAKGNSTVTFVANPLLVETSPGFGFLRTLHEIDLDQGSGTAIGKVPQDAIVSVCPLHREEIVSAAAQAIRQLGESIYQAGEDYTFSTVLAVSCIGRHLLMAPQSSAEVDQLLGAFPTGLTLSGFYGYGELGPMSSCGEDAPQLFAHNESLVLCAF